MHVPCPDLLSMLASCALAAVAASGGGSSMDQDPDLRPTPTPEADPARRERRIRALFLRHFCKYVRWPDRAFAGEDAPLVIGVLGRDPLGAELDAVFLNARTADGRRIVLRRLGRHTDLDGDGALLVCHLLLVTEADPVVQGKVIQALEKRPTLLVAELPGFADAGGGVQTFVADNKLRFEVNREALRRAGLSGSSKLLRLSREAPGRPGSDEDAGRGRRPRRDAHREEPK